jgi:hypothetical protein
MEDGRAASRSKARTTGLTAGAYRPADHDPGVLPCTDHGYVDAAR